MARKKEKKYTELKVRGFFRGQLVESETGSIVGDTGWVQNKLTNEGLTDLARLISGAAGSYAVGYAVLGTQTDAVDMSQTAVSGPVNSYKAVSTGTSGTCTATFTVSFGSASLTASCEVGCAALHKTDSAGSMIAMQTFATSAWATNQDFNLTYQIRFATA